MPEDFPTGYVKKPNLGLTKQQLLDLPDEKFAIYEQLMAAHQQEVEKNPLVDAYPHSPEQHDYLACKAFIGIATPGNQFGKCNRLGTEVRMADGLVKKIEDIVAGDWVVGVNLDGSTKPAKVTDSFSSGVKPVYRHRFSKRNEEAFFDATMEHKMLMRPESGENRSVAVGDAGSRWIATRTIGRDQLMTGLDEEYATFFGLMLGDGSFTENSTEMSFTSADDDITELMREAVSAFGYHLRQHPSNPIHFVINRPGHQHSRSPLKAKLEDHGLRCNANLKVIPEMVGQWSNHAVAELLAGLFLTDGTVAVKPGWSRLAFNSNSKRMCEQVKDLLADRFGIYGSQVTEHQREDRNPEYIFSVGNYAGLKRAAEVLPLVGEKARKLRLVVDNWSGKKSDGAELIYRGSEYITDEETWDITVDNETHLFALANGLVVSNSHANALLATINCVPLAYVPPHLRQYRTYQVDRPFACRIGVPTLDKHAEQIVLPILKKLIPVQTLEGGSWDKGWSSKKSQVTFKNGSHIEFRSYNQDVSDWAGSALDAILFDETPRQDLYEEGLRRFTTKANGFMRFAMTPRGLPWVYHELYRQRETNPDIEVFGGSSYDNPYADRKIISKIIGTSTNKAEIQQRLYGTFMSMEGRVLDDFVNHRMDDPLMPGHIIDDIEPKQLQMFSAADIIIGIDPEIRRPSAAFLRCDNLKEQVLMFNEYLPKLAVMNVGVFCEGLLRMCSEWNIKNPRFVIDPAAKASDINTGQTIISEFARQGVFCEPGNNNRELGIARMTALFANHQVGICRRCINMRDECDIWSWDEDAAERGESKAKKTKYAPNVLDSFRYGVMAIPWEPQAVFKEPPPPPGSTLEWIGSSKKKSEYVYG